MPSVGFTEVRDNLSSILDDVATKGEECVVMKHGQPIAVILGIEEYEALIESLNILSDNDTMEALAEAEEDLAEGRVSTEASFSPATG